MFGFLTLSGTCRGEADRRLVFHHDLWFMCMSWQRTMAFGALLVDRDGSTFIALLTIAQMPKGGPMKWSRRCNPLSRPRLVLLIGRAALRSHHDLRTSCKTS